jgi:hypothetical protein
MSDATPPPDLQFDRAEFAAASEAAACGMCGAAIHDAYYQVNEQVACEKCRWRVETEREGGSAAGRFVKAALFGVVAGALGAGLYFGVRALTGYEFGLIAVVVGLMVGGAVRAGSAKRGGVPYQILAMFLTYASIVSTYVPWIMDGLRAADTGQAEPAPAPAAAVADAKPGAPPPSGVAALPAPILVAIGFVLAFAAPFLMGIENIIGIVIIGIGLYEAWKINKKAALSISGPFRIADAKAAAPAAP